MNEEDDGYNFGPVASIILIGIFVAILVLTGYLAGKTS